MVLSPETSPESGQRFGDYIVEKRLATGGMAEIYLARHEGIEDFAKRVVLKRIRPELAAEPRFVRMFLDEARLAARLQHHNIAQVYDIGEADGEYFFAMEYLDGIDARTILHAAMEGEPIRQDIALGIVLAIASGLHHAHEARGADGALLGIVHRDISPSNVFITYDGAIKLVDFGIAKAQFQEGRTGSGTLKGKAPYMSPEQIRGDSIDRRSDVFSLGVVLFELATSSRLFRGKTEFQIFRQIVSGKTPSIRTLAPTMPSALAKIIAKAIARKPEKRYPTVMAFQRALDAFVAKEGLRVSDLEIAEYIGRRFADKEALALAVATRRPAADIVRARENAPTSSTLRRVLVAASLAALGVAVGWVVVDRFGEGATSAPPPVTSSVDEEPTAAESGPPAAAVVSTDAGPSAVTASSTPDASPPESSVPVAAAPVRKRARPRPRKQRKKARDTPTKTPAATKREWDPSSALPPPPKRDSK